MEIMKKFAIFKTTQNFLSFKLFWAISYSFNISFILRISSVSARVRKQYSHILNERKNLLKLEIFHLI